MKYEHLRIDKKWQDRWATEKTFAALDESEKEKFYCLVEFPYPSGSGLHVGHVRSYTAMDAVTRKARMNGKNVLYPIGWDAFGLPTENYAIKTGKAPQVVTKENTDRFRTQLQAIGLGFDWGREVNTTDPAYYKWTQWMFLEFFKAGLAYKKKMAINWCVSCKIGLANEEVVGGACERCGGTVEKRDKEQWMIAITKYADRLLEDLETVNYLDKIKKQQIDWIGRSEGASLKFEVRSSKHEVEVFTTRPDTILGVTYMVLAPEHPLVADLTTDEQKDAVAAYQKEVTAKTDIERGNAEKEKTGVFTGTYAVNPATGEEVPVWIADYVMMGYGTGAIMAVPQHDERDRAFAEAYNLPIIDAELLEMDDAIARTKGEKTVNYRLRDWVFSRQRYWGEPIPLVYCENCPSDIASEEKQSSEETALSTSSPRSGGAWIPVPKDQLPVELPPVEKYEPTDSGESPLADIEEWVNTNCPSCDGPAKRETDTMPNWAGSSWYFLRYADAKNSEAFASKDALKQWMQVDWYNGGMEHTTLHLLYSRFWNKFLFDQGHVPTSEPYARRTSHGLIIAEDGTKMSKAKGNVVDPLPIVEEYGADALRVYELFMGPFAEPVPWSMNGLVGVRRFLDKAARLNELVADEESEEVTRMVHKTVKKMTHDIDDMRFNVAVSQLMICTNTIQSAGAVTKKSLMMFAQVLCPFAPHLANELAEALGETAVLENTSWPEWDEALTVDDEVEFAVQVNGKLRATIKLAPDAAEEVVVAAAKGEENVAKYLEGEIKKTIFVPGKLVNFVV
jgi:leucyl-tRNA synthetase